MILRNANSTKLEIREMFKPKLGKVISKLELKHEKFIFLELDMYFNSKLSSSMKLKFDEI